MTEKAEAIIYVRGGNKEMQEAACRAYALDNDYKVLYATQHIENVKLCDVLLIVEPTRISRDVVEYYKVVNELEKKGIKVVSIANQKDIEESEMLARRLYEKLNNKK